MDMSVKAALLVIAAVYVAIAFSFGESLKSKAERVSACQDKEGTLIMLKGTRYCVDSSIIKEAE